MFFRSNSTAIQAVFSALCVSFSLPIVSSAQGAAQIVISPSRVEQPPDRVGSKVLQMDGETLRQQGVEFIEDALQQVPSLLVTRSAGRGSQVQLRVRGNEANHLLVLIDGIRVSNASTGEFDFSTLGMDSIETIEVLLGPQSAIYGSDAIAGVILITTRRGRAGTHGRLGIQAGERGTRSINAGVDGGLAGMHYALSIENFSSDGISSADQHNGNDEKDPFDKQSFNLRAGYDHQDFSTSLVYSQTDADYDFDGSDANGIAIDQTGNNQQTAEQRFAWLLEWPALDQRLKQTLQLSRVEFDYDTVSVFFGAASDYATRTQRDALEYRGSYRFNPLSSLQFGVEQINEYLETASVSSYGNSLFDQNVSEAAYYLNWLYRLGTTDISLGARNTQHDEFGSQVTYRVTASHPLVNDLRLRAAHGTAYKTPSLQELYDPGFGGNSDLNPEQSVSSEVGLEYQPNDWKLALTYFDQQTKDLIRYVGFYPDALNENVGKAHSHGVELEASRDWSGFHLGGRISQTQASEIQDGDRDRRIRVPEWAAGLLGRYQFARGQVYIEMQYKGKRRDIQFSFPQQDVTLDSYTLWNMGASYHPMKRLTVSARVENLTDEDYAEVFSFGTPGRTALLAANWSF